MKKLSIPEHISLEKEFLPGMGPRELRQYLTAAVPGLVVMVLIWVFAGSPRTQVFSMLLGMGYLAICFAFFVKIEGGHSMYIFLAHIVRFYREQNKFQYKQEKEAIRNAAHDTEP